MFGLKCLPRDCQLSFLEGSLGTLRASVSDKDKRRPLNMKFEPLNPDTCFFYFNVPIQLVNDVVQLYVY